MQTVVARFHHRSRDLDRLEADLVAAGAENAHITGYTVALTFGAEPEDEVRSTARRILDGIGATRIKIPKHQPKPAETNEERRRDRESATTEANLMSKFEMDVFGHP